MKTPMIQIAIASFALSALLIFSLFVNVVLFAAVKGGAFAL